MENQKGNQVEKKEEKKKQASFVKSKLALAALVVVGVLIGYEIGIRAYFSYIRPYFSGMAYRNYVDAYIQLQLNDYTGGETPEETVDLFIAALKKGDYGLASKYFVISEQEKWRKSFDKPNKENIDNWIKELEDNKNSWRKEIQAENKVVFKYNTGAGENEITNFIVLKKNMNNKWKIGGF